MILKLLSHHSIYNDNSTQLYSFLLKKYFTISISRKSSPLLFHSHFLPFQFQVLIISSNICRDFLQTACLQNKQHVKVSHNICINVLFQLFIYQALNCFFVVYVHFSIFIFTFINVNMNMCIHLYVYKHIYICGGGEQTHFRKYTSMGSIVSSSSSSFRSFYEQEQVNGRIIQSRVSLYFASLFHIFFSYQEQYVNVI